MPERDIDFFVKLSGFSASYWGTESIVAEDAAAKEALPVIDAATNYEVSEEDYTEIEVGEAWAEFIPAPCIVRRSIADKSRSSVAVPAHCPNITRQLHQLRPIDPIRDLVHLDYMDGKDWSE